MQITILIEVRRTWPRLDSVIPDICPDELSSAVMNIVNATEAKRQWLIHAKPFKSTGSRASDTRCTLLTTCVSLLKLDLAPQPESTVLSRLASSTRRVTSRTSAQPLDVPCHVLRERSLGLDTVDVLLMLNIQPLLATTPHIEAR